MKEFVRVCVPGVVNAPDCACVRCRVTISLVYYLQWTSNVHDRLR